MKITAIALVSLVLPSLASSLLALDPGMLNFVSPAATSLAGVDMVRVQASPFGQYLMKQAGQHGANLDQIASATGFDVRRDLQEVLIASSSPAASHQGLIIARGAFDQQRLLGMAKTAGLLSTSYKGVTLLTPQQNTSSTDFEAAAFVAGYLVAGSRADVEGAIDRSSAKNSSSNGLTSRALLASTRYDAWVVTSTAADLAQGLPGAGAQGIPLRGISSFAAGVQFGNQVDIGMEAETRSTQDATSLADVLRFAAALGQSNQAAAQLGNLLSTLTITTEGNFVRAALKMSQADLEKMLNGQSARARRIASR